MNQALAVVIGDTHIHNFRCSGALSPAGVSQRAQLVLDAIKRVVTQHRPKHLIQLGDLHHVSNPLPSLVGATEQLLYSLLGDHTGGTIRDAPSTRHLEGSPLESVTLLAGNHDAATLSNHSLLAYKWMPGITVVGPDEVHLIPHVGVCIAWTVNPDVVLRGLRLAAAHGLPVFAHAAVDAEGVLSDGSTEAFLGANDLLHCLGLAQPMVVSGHLHNMKQVSSKVTQLGAFHGVSVGEYDVGYYMVIGQGGSRQIHRTAVPVSVKLTEENYADVLMRTGRGIMFGEVLTDRDSLDDLPWAKQLCQVGNPSHLTARPLEDVEMTAPAQVEHTGSYVGGFMAAAERMIPADHPHRTQALDLANRIALSSQSSQE